MTQPEKWNRAPHGNYWPNAICDGSHVLAIVQGSGYPIGVGWSPESERVAQMMVAAPVMLAALKDLLDAIPAPRGRKVTEAWDKAYAAIEFAETPIWGPPNCIHDWHPARPRSGGCVGLVCTRCGAEDEKDVS